MRRNTFFGRLFLEFVSVFLVVAPFSVYAEATGVSVSLKDDVTAMITSAKKMPHQIFIVDSSESMNSFAYSDYVDNCKDAEVNLNKALALCENAYNQCRNVENNAMCGVDLNCGDITPKCNQIRSTKTKLQDKCREITIKKYPEPGMFETVSVDDAKAKKYVGPWNPTRKDYTQDLCFYDWTSDSHNDVMDETSSAEDYNKKKYCTKHGYSGGNCDTKFEEFLASSGGSLADRSDWDCLTDGSNKILPANSASPNSTYYLTQTGGVSGLWLNWKYATSLDAVKIILADTHQFSVQPRYRGENLCYETKYLPYKQYEEPELDSEGNPVYDESGQPKIVTKYMCFVAYDPSLTGVPESQRAAQLESLKSAVEANWTPIHSDEEVLASNCTGFSLENFPLYDSDDYDIHTREVGVDECGKCMKWTANSDGTGSFTETNCSTYNGSGVSTESKKLDDISGSLSKNCCKTFQCPNPKCRDNDMCCKDNNAAFPTDDGSEEYQICRSGSGYSCTLGFYSEYDQDANHCCSEVVCAEFGERENYSSNGETCQTCKNGSVVGSDVLEQQTAVVNVVETPVGHASCGPESTEDMCNPIPITIGIKESDLTSLPFDDLASIKVTAFYGCIYNDESHTVLNPDYPSNDLGTGTCTTAEDCADLVSGTLSGCDTKGYRVMAQVVVTRKNCKFDNLNISFELQYSIGTGTTTGNFEQKYIFDTNFNDTDPIYHVYSLQASSSTEKIYEYECKTAFYNRETVVRSGGSCPNANDAPYYINQNHQGDKVEYCEARTAEREVIARDQWGTATKVACSWLCRSAELYEEPWKCASFFFMMDDVDRNGPAACNTDCFNAMDDNTKLSRCCKCINREQGRYNHHKTPSRVEMVDPDTGNLVNYTCSVSGYQYATGSNGFRTTSSGYQAEIINGHIKEGVGEGYYNLSPYYASNGTLWSPYASYENNDDPGTGGWYSKYSLIHSDNGARYLGDSFTSLFTTNDETNKREPVCVYDLLWGWSGTDCDSSSCGGSGCCSIDLSQNSNNCDYPTFWMKIPEGDGGKLLMNAKELTKHEHVEEFRTHIKKLKALGGSTLGETLYDAWRYLGGMYALHDKAHVFEEDPSNPGSSLNPPYTSPYAAQDPQCFTNEAIIVSGGNPQYDDNSVLEKEYGVNCDKYSPELGDSPTVNHGAKPCVKANEVESTQHSPYDKNNEWQKTAIQNVAQFVNRNTFWSDPNVEGHENCNPAKVSDNPAGFSTSCGGNDPKHDIPANVPLIDRVHAMAIGEWGLTAMYQSLTNNAQVQGFMDATLMQNAAKMTSREGEAGRYYTLTATGNASGSTLGGGSFDNLSSLFADFVNKTRSSSVVVGRPHWTSSLVQPFDVEEKYRGPEAYTAGAVPVDGSISRFWFGNLKKYDVSGGNDCPITDDTAATSCGEWKKQTFDAKDCFGLNDSSTTDFSTGDSADKFKKLMVGGAAYKLKKKLEGSPCGSLPCYKTTPRNIYYDLGAGSMQELKTANTAILTAKLKDASNNRTLTDPTTEKIFDYMAGYDAFEEFGDRKEVRYTSKSFFNVDDPFDVDFTHAKQIKFRPLLLGAIIHSKPLAVYYNDSSTTRIYVGANDGMLHAFDGNGEEVYAYVPSLAFNSITNFAETSHNIFFNASVDGPISMLHIDQNHDGIINNGEKAYLVFGYRRGAKGYTVIDISNKDKPEFVQNLNTNGGLSFGKAVVFRKCSGTCSYADQLDYYLAVPGGYDDCHDPSALTTASADNTPSCKLSQLKGNNFVLYKFNKSSGKFESPLSFTTTSSNWTNEVDKEWLLTSFASVPFAVNTSGKAAVNTEFVYFTDLSGTVFRVDVRENDMSNWKAKIVFTEREEKSLDKVWGQIGRTYVASNFYPPLERYNPARNPNDNGDLLIPIPVVTGNAANPKYKKQEGIFVFYDKKDGSNTPLYTNDFMINVTGESHTPKNGMIENKRGWQVNFNKDNGEKGITEPLIVYDIYGGSDPTTSNSYSIAWNTYIPMKATECKTFGTSSNYERYIPDGAQAFKNTSLSGANGEWSVANDTTGQCVSDSSNISLATSVGIIATDNGYDLTFGAGSDIFRKEKLNVVRNKTYIIKWYELY